MKLNHELTNLKRIPVRQNDKIILLPVSEIASIVAKGRILHLATVTKESYEIDYRLKDLEEQLDSTEFIRLSRHTLANVEWIRHTEMQKNGTYLITLKNDSQFSVSRIQSKILRESLFKL